MLRLCIFTNIVFECSSHILKMKKKKRLKSRMFHGLYWAMLGFLDTKNANYINGEK